MKIHCQDVWCTRWKPCWPVEQQICLNAICRENNYNESCHREMISSQMESCNQTHTKIVSALRRASKSWGTPTKGAPRRVFNLEEKPHSLNGFVHQSHRPAENTNMQNLQIVGNIVPGSSKRVTFAQKLLESKILLDSLRRKWLQDKSSSQISKWWSWSGTRTDGRKYTTIHMNRCK